MIDSSIDTQSISNTLKEMKRKLSKSIAFAEIMKLVIKFLLGF